MTRGIDVQPDDLAAVKKILAHHVPEYEVWAFGSRVKGKARRFSDLDLAIVTDTPLSLERLAALREAFVESALPFKADLLDWAATSSNVKAGIAAAHLVIQDPTRGSGGAGSVPPGPGGRSECGN